MLAQTRVKGPPSRHVGLLTQAEFRGARICSAAFYLPFLRSARNAGKRRRASAYRGGLCLVRHSRGLEFDQARNARENTVTSE